MKADIHPTVHQVKVSCVCGHEIDTISTTKNLTIGVCSHCHPFYTGKQKLVDTAGRVERFQKRYNKKKG